ncbi:uncharacterized protein ARMOST_22682 [Armillaria ostoyae]|uniref:Uncharacterized protein n=1 Tax=Armillaria ostoyae TaxID=47428 RepID=A0A284SDK6_ARMOS|nr:uncharacterized protein ARMOST_21724 [Armillaria ostoyae]SJL18971.1 uncharacterized protein ARMOST_22574 [Armillaria ostoyae]SJL19074.1 uncharacterized protein ARMOST_22682 [Armillaria ostoyae]
MSDLPLTSTTTICAATDLRDILGPRSIERFRVEWPLAVATPCTLERTVGAAAISGGTTAHGDVLGNGEWQKTSGRK